MANSRPQKRPWLFFVNLLAGILFFPLVIRKIFLRSAVIDQVQNILVVELWGIGDLVMASGALKALREKFPSAKISLLSKPEGEIIFKETCFVDQFISFSFPWTKFKGKYRLWEWDWKDILALLRALREQKFDVIIDARGDIRNNFLSFLIAGKRRLGYAWTGGGFFLTDAGPAELMDQHRTKAWAQLLRFLNIPAEDCPPLLSVSEQEEEWAVNFLAQKGIFAGDTVVGIHPGAGRKIRCWPLERFGEVASYVSQNYPAKIVVFIEPDGYGGDMPSLRKYVPLWLSLRELIVLVKKMSLLICNDSGVMHIASAWDIPTIAIFGPGDFKKIGPRGSKSSVVVKEEVECRPCFDSCRQARAFCLDGVPVSEVIKKMDEKLPRQRSG
ncbi:MAG: glycosyltransferase family 9 protein [Candidatus Omnitrophota bacterium]